MAALIALISAVTLVVPDKRIAFELWLMAGAGLGAIAAIRIALAMIFLQAASASRAPRLVRGFGIIVLLAGLATPWFGTDRGQSIVNELIKSGPTVMRINGVVGLVLGVGLFSVLRQRREINARVG